MTHVSFPRRSPPRQVSCYFQVSALLTQLTWTQHLMILSQCSSASESSGPRPLPSSDSRRSASPGAERYGKCAVALALKRPN